MSLLNILSGGILKGFESIIDEVYTSDEERLALEIDQKKIENNYKDKLLEIEKVEIEKQSEINKVEASNRNIFVAGWRPCIGWICAMGLFYSSIFYPLLSNVVNIKQLDLSLLLPILMGMLGLGGLRTYEKIKKVAK